MKNIPLSGKTIQVVTPSDTVDFTPSINAMLGLYCSAAGNVALVLHDGSVVVVAVVAGAWLPVQVKRVNATSTTVAADSISAYWG